MEWEGGGGVDDDRKGEGKGVCTYVIKWKGGMYHDGGRRESIGARWEESRPGEGVGDGGGGNGEGTVDIWRGRGRVEEEQAGGGEGGRSVFFSLFFSQRRQNDGVGVCVCGGGWGGAGRLNTGEDSSAGVDRQCFVSRLINRAKCICSLPNLSEDAERRRRRRRMGRKKRKENHL